MLNWLRKKIHNRQRLIFTFWDGSQIARVDPMKIHRALMSHPSLELESHLELIDDDQDIRNIVLGAIRDIFEVSELDRDGRGLTEEETFNLLWNFLNYCTLKKKSANPSPMPPTSTESATSANSTMPGDSDFTSTFPESKFDMPPVS